MLLSYFNQPYIAVIGDIKRSRSIKDREHVQQTLKETLEFVNRQYQNDIASNFTITLGDEFQALLANGACVMQILNKIKQTMYPIEIRFGIGIGGMRTEFQRQISIGSDGPSYYMARSAIEYLKKNEQRNTVSASAIRIETDETNMAAVALLNTILSLLSVIESQWSVRRRAVIFDMYEHNDSQSNVAARLGIEQPSVNRHLARGNYYTYIDAVRIVDETLGSIRRTL